MGESTIAKSRTDVADVPGTAPLRANRDFTLLWTGQTVSLIGSEITEVAFPLVAVLSLNAGAGQLGLINAARTTPAIAVTLVAGVLVDRWRRRRTMALTNVGRAVAVGLVPLLALAGVLSVPALCVIGFVLGTLTIVFDLANHAFLPSLVSGDQLVAANSRLETSTNIARIGGPGLGGVLVALLRAPAAMAVDAASYLVSAGSLALIRTPDQPADRLTGAAPERRRMLPEIAAGLRLTFGDRCLRALTVESAVFNFGIQIFLTLFLLYGAKDAGLSASLLGAVMALGAVGGLAGALSVPRLVPRLGLGRTMVVALLTACVGPLATPLVVAPAAAAVAVMAVSFFVTLFGVVLSGICTAVLRQSLVPNASLGRVTASQRFLTGGVLPVASLCAGLLGSVVGVRWAILLGVLVLPFSLLPVLRSPLPGLRTPADAQRFQAVPR
jgi:Na+/melibiose symporter-like transporter